MFAELSKSWRTPILTVAGAIDAIVHYDEHIDDTGLIPGMITAYGDDWFLVQDGPTSQAS
jgi:hypothetical protein